MDTSSITQTAETINFLYFYITPATDLTGLPDDIYLADSGEWVVVVGGLEANRTEDYGLACRQYAAAVRQGESIPFNGMVDELLQFDGDELIFASSADLYGMNEATL